MATKRRKKSTKKRTTKRRASTSARRGTQVVVVRANPTAHPSRKRRRTRRTARRVSNPSPPSRRRRSVRRRSNPMGAIGTGFAVAGVAIATGVGLAMVLPTAFQHASPRAVGIGLGAIGIGGAMIAQKSPILGYPIAALGGGIGGTLIANSFGINFAPQPQPTMGQLAMGAVEQVVGAIGHGEGSEVYRTPIASSQSLGWL